MNKYEILKSLFLPISYILKPTEAGKEKASTSIISATSQAIISIFLLSFAYFGIISSEKITPDMRQLFAAGALFFPMIICLIGLLLHSVYPAKDQKMRVVRMICVPWNIIASALTITITLFILQVIYFSTSSLESQEIIRISKSMNDVNIVIISGYTTWILINCLSNIRETSKLRNSGDALLVTALLCTPYFIL